MNSFREMLSEEQRGEYLLSRINQLAVSGYQLELDMQVMVNNSETESAAQLNQQIRIIKDAIKIHQNELEGE